ncbi:MAG: polyprenyl synthetase family protein, partial [Actinobacteria bacterium]|nr:polyprenyl synthetase family protein [Actinomycetota bacterium]
MLSFLSAPSGIEAPVVPAVAVELVHLATLVHDDLI